MVPDGSAMWFSLIIFSIAFIAAEFAAVFTNAILPSLGSREEIGKISGNGMAFGYVGVSGFFGPRNSVTHQFNVSSQP